MAEGDYLHLVWGGELGSPAMEIWTNSLKIAVGTERDHVLDVADQQAAAEAIQPLVEAYVSAGTTQIAPYSAAAKLTWIKANMVSGMTGRYIHDETTVIDLETPVSGKAGTNNWRQSLVVTLRSAGNRGAGRIGRFYPVGSIGVGDNALSPYVAASSAEDLAEFAQTLVNGINSIMDVPSPGTYYPLTVCNIPSPYTGFFGSVRPVETVEVDRVYDTQRRRTNAVPRAAESKTITYNT